MASMKRTSAHTDVTNEEVSPLKKTKLVSEVITSPWGLKNNDHSIFTIHGIIESGSYSSSIPRIERFTRLSFPTPNEELSFDIFTSYMTFPTKSMLPPECVNPIQDNLFKEIHALKKMSIKEERTGNSGWQIAASDIPKNELCSSLVHAFLYNMNDNDGKSAIAMLMNRIVTELHLQYTVRQTGFSGRPSRYATCVKMEYTVESLTSSDSTEDGSDSPRYIPSMSVRDPTPDIGMETPRIQTLRGAAKTSPENTSPSSSSDTEKRKNKPKFMTPDIIVFKQDNLYKAPLTKLVISIKSGFKEGNGQQLITEMLSRMQYQDSIYGLEINAAKSVIYKVQKTKTSGGVGKNGKVHIFTYPSHIFIKHNEPFALENFNEMLLNVAYVLYKEQE